MSERTRQRLGNLFWHGLTALAFAAVVVLMFVKPVHAAPPGLAGTWRVGLDGTLREIHVGWAGPATGSLNVRAKRDFDATVQRLLRERA